MLILIRIPFSFHAHIAVYLLPLLLTGGSHFLCHALQRLLDLVLVVGVVGVAGVEKVEFGVAGFVEPNPTFELGA